MTNDGKVSGSKTITFKVNSKVVSTQTVTLGAGATQRVSYVVKPTDPGTYNVDIDGYVSSFIINAPIRSIYELIQLGKSNVTKYGWDGWATGMTGEEYVELYRAMYYAAADGRILLA